MFCFGFQILGASWYLLSLGRQFSCWQTECKKENALGLVTCMANYLDCSSLDDPDRQYWLNATKVVGKCDAKNNNIHFKFGMFQDAFTNDVVSTPRFIEKYLYCLWWGLRNLRYICTYNYDIPSMRAYNSFLVHIYIYI